MNLLLSLIPGSFFESNGPSYIVIAMFLILGLLSAGLIAPLIRRFFKNGKISFLALFCFALMGGMLGICMHFYAMRYMVSSQNPKPASLLSEAGLFLAFLFANMLAFPFLAGLIYMQQKRIRELETSLSDKINNLK